MYTNSYWDSVKSSNDRMRVRIISKQIQKFKRQIQSTQICTKRKHVHKKI
jgi:hypothetical protein